MKTIRCSPKKYFGAFAFCVLLAMTGAQSATPDWKTAAQMWAQSVTLEQKGDLDGALAKMPEFYRASADAYLTSLRTGWLYYRKQKYTQAAQAYQEASNASPYALNPLIGMANAYRAVRDTSRAAQISERVITIDPLNYTALMMLGGIHYERQDYQRAAKTYKTLLDAYPEDAAVLSGTAWSLLKSNMKREAAEDFQRLLSLSPNYPFALQGLNMATGINSAPVQLQ